MTDMTCMIIDDEPLAVKLLESFVAKTPGLRLVSSFTDSVKALAALSGTPVNIVFLDIQMPDMNGMELSRMLPSDTKIIFTTAFKEYAFDSYEVSALDFLLKPIRYNKFIAAVEKARQWFEMATMPHEKELSSVFIRVDGELRRISIADILYVCGMKDYLMFYLDGVKRPLITHLTMKAVEDMLPSNQFMRVHRSYIVALERIRSIDRNSCIYIGDEVVRVTDAYREAFDAYIRKRAGGRP